MNHFAAQIVAGALVIALGSACAPSTHYQPKDPSRAYLSVVGGELAIRKGGAATAEGPIDQLVRCDESARTFANHSRTLFREATDLRLAAAVLDGFFGPLMIGLVLRGVAANKQSSSNAALIDAINSHNDSLTCPVTAGPAPIASKEGR